MARSRQQTARKPATKFAQLQKKLRQQKVRANQQAVGKQKPVGKKPAK